MYFYTFASRIWKNFCNIIIWSIIKYYFAITKTPLINLTKLLIHLILALASELYTFNGLSYCNNIVLF